MIKVTWPRSNLIENQAELLIFNCSEVAALNVAWRISSNLSFCMWLVLKNVMTPLFQQLVVNWALSVQHQHSWLYCRKIGVTNCHFVMLIYHDDVFKCSEGQLLIKRAYRIEPIALIFKKWLHLTLKCMVRIVTITICQIGCGPPQSWWYFMCSNL